MKLSHGPHRQRRVDVAYGGVVSSHQQKAAGMVVTSRYLVQGLSQAELAAHRALMDGLIVPTIAEGENFWQALETARKGYSTRYVPVSQVEDGLSAGSVKAALENQVHRGERVRNKDWLVVQALTDPALRACTLLWAAFRGGGVRADDFDEVYRLLGLAVGSHRRLAILRGLERDGLLSQDRYRIFRLIGNPDEVIDATCPWWRLYFGLNILTPAVFQRFRQADGAMLAVWNVKIDPSELPRMHAELAGLVDEKLRCICRPLRDLRESERPDHLLLGTFCTTYDSRTDGVNVADSIDWRKLILMGPVADSLSKLGPWEVAAEIVRRRFVEYISERTGLQKVSLYRHVADRYGVTSANTVRSYLDGPSLVGSSAGRGFNRGRLSQVVFRVRCILAEMFPEPALESVVKDRFLRAEGIPHVDQALWNSSVRALEEEDFVVRLRTPSGTVLSLRTEPAQIVHLDLDRAEAGVRLLMSRVLMATQALNGVGRASESNADLWVVPRGALMGLRERIYDAVRSWIRVTGAPNLHLTVAQEEALGLIPGEFLLASRSMPLLP